MDPKRIEWMAPKDIKTEDGADELMQSAMMRPYVRLAGAMLANQGVKEAVAEVERLPLEQRYVWRILLALKWGFADFDSGSVAIDRKTLANEDRITVAELLQLRPIQFCLFLKALVGSEAMEQMMMQAIRAAK